MTTSDIVMVAAIFLAPFIAVFVQRQIDRLREKHGRKLAIFKSLMATRGAKLSPEHVQALNMIDLEFTERKFEEIRRIWKEYLDHLGSLTALDAERQIKALPAWTTKSDDLLASLLHEMGSGLGYDFDKVHLKRGIYSPQGHADIELENTAVRRLLLQVLMGNHSLPMTTKLLPLDDEAAANGKRLIDGLNAVLEGRQALKYELNTNRGEQGAADQLPARGESK